MWTGVLSGQALTSKTIVVFPFENQTKNPSMEWIGDSFVETLNDQLASPNFSPFSWEQRNAAYDLMGLPYDGNFSHATFFKVGEELDANFAVIGNFHLENGDLVATARLINLDHLQVEATFSERGPLDTLKRIQSHLAWRILTHFDSTFPLSWEDFYRQSDDVPLSAFENYVRGRRALDSKSQLQFFLKAERLDTNYSKAIFQIGKIYYQQKDYATSQLWLRRLNKGERHFYEASFYLGLDDYFLNNYEKSAGYFADLSQHIPLNEVFNNLGAAFSREGHLREAASSYFKAVQGDPSDADFNFNLGYTYWKSNDYASAARYLREAAKLDSTDAEAFYLLSQVLDALKQDSESAKYLQTATRLNPKVASWKTGALPPLDRVKGNYDAEAFRQLKDTLDNLQEQKRKNRPPGETATGHLSRGLEFYRGEQIREAMREFEETVRIDPRSSDAYYYLGLCQEREGRFEDAIRQFKAAIQLRDELKPHLALAHLYYTLDRRADARGEVAAALALDPNNPEAREMQALLQQAVSSSKKQ